MHNPLLSCSRGIPYTTFFVMLVFVNTALYVILGNTEDGLENVLVKVWCLIWM